MEQATVNWTVKAVRVLFQNLNRFSTGYEHVV